MADPGFPIGGMNPLGGCGPLTWSLSARNVCENERIGYRRGSVHRERPSRSANVYVLNLEKRTLFEDTIQLKSKLNHWNLKNNMAIVRKKDRASNRNCPRLFNYLQQKNRTFVTFYFKEKLITNLRHCHNSHANCRDQIHLVNI